MNELSNEKKMTVKEIAESLGVSVRFIQEKVKALFPEIIQERKTTYLNEGQVAKIKIEIEKNPYCAQVFAVNSDVEMGMKAVEIADYFRSRNEELKKEVENLTLENIKIKPKAENYEKFVESDHLFSMKQTADLLNKKGFGRNNLCSFLRNTGIFSSKSSNWNLPYREFIDIGYFEVKETFIDAMDEIQLTPYATQKGIDWIKKQIEDKQ